VLQTLSPEARAVLSDLSGRARRRDGVVTNLADYSASDRALLEELVDARLIRREDEATVTVLLDQSQRADLSQERRPAVALRLTSSRSTTDSQEVGRLVHGFAVDSPTSGGRVKTRSEVSRKRPGASLQRTPVDLWRGSHLSAHFIREVGDQAVLLRIALGPAPFNVKALSGQINRWLREGLTPAEVKAMIDLFVTDLARFASRNVPVWKTFLARRQMLYRQAARVAEESRSTDSDDSYWLADAEPTTHEIDWIGA